MSLTTRRAFTLMRARMAGYHEDAAAWTRVLCEPGVSHVAKTAEYRIGQRMRAAGARCDCWSCREAAKTKASA